MKRVIEYVLACMGTAVVAWVAKFCLPADKVAIGYAVIMVAVLLVAWLTRQEIFVYQALVLLGFTAFQLSTSNFYDLRHSLSAGPGAKWSAVAAILVLAAGVVLAFQVRVLKTANGQRRKWYTFLADRPEQPMFFVPVLLMGWLLLIEAPEKLTLAWAMEGVAVFILALIAKERSFRLTGLALLMVCVVKTLLDVLRPGTSSTTRYLTLIGLGVILLIVSFLYGRFRETLREYL